ncbi:MAG: hypothetical protein Phog2KO_31300 [Phototrophicaceae bacterium]
MTITKTVLNNRFQVDFEDPANFIGQGGMGTVYRGLDIQTQTPIAVKVLKGDLLQRDPELIQRFRREGQTLRQLNHPNIVKMLGSSEKQGVNYLLMEYVGGGSLRDILEDTPKLSIQRALYIALDITDALTRAHRLEVLHRDIKPGNVLLADDGTPRLTDFGMARVSGEPQITQDGAIVGTMAYLAPEAFKGEVVDERTDIWAFGVMLWEMIAGQRPFPQEQPAPLIQAIVTHPLPDLEKIRSDVPTALVDLIYRMLDKNRASRIPSARLIGAELEALIRGGSSTLQPVISVEDSTGRFDLETTEFPAPNKNNHFVAPNNLQHQPTPFVGREDELEKLQELLTGHASLITLTGPGGIGKSRISVALAEKSLSHYEDGVYNISLDCLESSNNVVNTIGENIGFSFGGGEPKTELLNYLREKHMLLVLDNFETVMDAADLIAEITATAPQVSLVVTSRERLRLRGEVVFDVDAMDVPTPKQETLEALQSFPVTKLFLQSAKRALPSFELNEDNTGDVAEILRLVGGLPLGIELAAGWLEMMPIDEIVTEIENSLDFLETDLRDVPERHRSLRAVADYSWNLLNDDERDIFLKLSIFRSGFEREAAQKIAGASLRNLTNLVNKSLLVREPQGRYYVHKLLRQYGEERFKDHEEAMPTHMAFADYYIKLSQKLGEAMNTSKEQAAFEGFDKEIDNVRYLWRMGQTFEKFDKMNKLQDTLFDYYLGRSMFYEGAELFDNFANKMAQVGQEDAIYWRARTHQALFIVRQGDYDLAIQYANDALNFFDASHQHERVLAYIVIGNALMFQGDYDHSIEILEQGYESLPNESHWFYAAIMSSLGYVNFLKGDLLMARDIYATLLEKVTDENYAPSVIANVKNNYGEVLQRLGDYKRALQLFKESLEISKAPRNPRAIAIALLNISGIHFIQTDYERAEGLLEEGYALYREMGDRWGLAQALSNMGNIAMAKNDHETAHEKYNQALTIRRGLGERRGIADSLSDLAYCAMTQGANDISQTYFGESLEIRREIGDRIGEGSELAFRGIGNVLAGNHNKALKDLSLAQVIGEETGSPLIRAQAYSGLGEVALQQKNYDAATRYFKMVLRENDAEDAPIPMILWSLLGLAYIKIEHGDAISALQMVTLILRYPHNYIGMIEKRAKKLMDDLSQQMSQQDIETTLSATKSLVLRNYVAELLAEE